MEEKLLADAASDDLPSPASRILKVAGQIAALLALLGIVLLPVAAVVVIAPVAYIETVDPSRPAEISIVVDGCAGLDGARVPRAFNFTVAIDNTGSRFDTCMGGGDAVVLYAGVPLAAGYVPYRCVPPRGAGEVAIRVASGGVGLPGELAALMADEARRAGGVVRLEVRVVSLERLGSLKCKASLGGGAAVAQPSPCDGPVLVDESDGVVRPIYY